VVLVKADSCESLPTIAECQFGKAAIFCPKLNDGGHRRQYNRRVLRLGIVTEGGTMEAL